VSSRLATASFSEKQTLVQLLIEKIIVGEGTLEIHHVIPLHRAPPDASGPGPPVMRLRSHGMDLTALPARALEGAITRRT
jgi:site-specific DNA recombinase